MLGPLQRGEWEHPNLKPFTLVLRDAGRMALPESGLRDIVALQAYRRADELDGVVAARVSLQLRDGSRDRLAHCAVNDLLEFFGGHGI